MRLVVLFVLLPLAAAAAPAVLDAERVRPTLTDIEAPAAVRRAWTDLRANRRLLAIHALTAFAVESPAHPMAPAALVVAADAAEREGEPREAALLFALAAAEPGVLQDVARIRGAAAATAGGDLALALELAESVSPASPRAWEAFQIRVRALRKLRRPEDAVELRDADAGRRTRAQRRWRSAQLAAALAAAGAPARAAKTYRRLTLRYPGEPVAELAERRLKALRRTLSREQWRGVEADAPEDLLARAWAAHEKRRSAEAVEILAPLAAPDGPPPGGPLWCQARWLEGEAWTAQRAHAQAAEAFSAYGDACEDDRTPEALYRAGRAHFNHGADEAARDALRQMWTVAPEHPLADDAMFVSARVLEDAGRSAEAHALFGQLIDEHPEGDHAAAAYWRRYAQLLQVEGPAFAGAIDVEPGAERERAVHERGRLRYFRGRALERTGREGEAVAMYLRVVSDAPMGYYALLALNRLMVLDPEAAEGTLQAVVNEADAFARPPEIRPPGVEQQADFREGLALVRLGLHMDAWRAFRRIEERLSDPDRYRQTVARLFAEAGVDRFARNIRRRVSHFEGVWPVGADAPAYEVGYPHEYQKDIDRWSDERGVPPALIYGLIREESRFRPQVVSPTQACGLMQLMVPTARDLARADGVRGRVTCRGLQRPALNIRLGTRFLADLLEDYSGHLGLTVATYHAGYGNVRGWLQEWPDLPFDEWVETIPFVQTRRYIKNGLATLWVYQWSLAAEDAPMSDRVPRVPLALDGGGPPLFP